MASLCHFSLYMHTFSSWLFIACNSYLLVATLKLCIANGFEQNDDIIMLMSPTNSVALAHHDFTDLNCLPKRPHRRGHASNERFPHLNPNWFPCEEFSNLE
ncbi:hypothetical protein DsansV1_C38g0234161 [Dioscorea sansibarensis]